MEANRRQLPLTSKQKMPYSPIFNSYGVEDPAVNPTEVQVASPEPSPKPEPRRRQHARQSCRS